MILETTAVVKGVVALIMFSLLTSSLSLFLWKCMESGMILRRYYLLLIYYWIKWHRQKDRWKRYVLKPLGSCIYCSSTWLCIISALMFFNVKYYNYIPFAIGINYIFIEIGLKYIKYNH